MGLIDVEVVAKSESLDYTEFMTGLVRFGEIDATSVNDMVTKVKERATEKSATVNRLDIFAHGTSNYISLGSDVIHAWTPKAQVPKLRGLRGIVAASGVVTLMVCNVGQSQDLLCAMAEAIGTKVQANRGDVSPNLGMGWGAWVVAWPNGTIATVPSGGAPY